MSSDDDWENFDVSAARRDSDSEEEFIESESEPEDTNVPKVGQNLVLRSKFTQL